VTANSLFAIGTTHDVNEATKRARLYLQAVLKHSLNGNLGLGIAMMMFIVVMPAWRYVEGRPQQAMVARKTDAFTGIEGVDWARFTAWARDQ
jgi:hypothetical protein